MLRQQFPKDISGEIIICREALVDGEVNADSLDELFKSRASYLSQYEVTNTDYHKDVIPEFQKIIAIPEPTEINLWFEFDLFCQVNMWFVISLLKNQQINLVLPQSEQGFGTMNEKEISEAFDCKKAVSASQLAILKKLWPAYQTGNISKIEELAAGLKSSFPFLLNAAKAYERMLNGDLRNTIKQILAETNPASFKEVYSQFCGQEPTFGFGDLQVKRIYDELISNR